MAIKILTSSIARPSEIYPNLDFWFENEPSGSTVTNTSDRAIFFPFFVGVILVSLVEAAKPVSQVFFYFFTKFGFAKSVDSPSASNSRKLFAIRKYFLIHPHLCSVTIKVCFDQGC
jgi:hypothetical protein